MNAKEVAEALKNYHWMINEIARSRGILAEDWFRGIAQYGIEATLPKASGFSGDAIANEVIRRETKSKRVMRLEAKVKHIQDRLYLLQDDMEKVVVDCLLDGMSVTAISKHMGLSRQYIHTTINNIANTLADS